MAYYNEGMRYACYFVEVIRLIWKKKYFFIFITLWWFLSNYLYINSSDFSSVLSWETGYFCFPVRIWFSEDYTDNPLCVEDFI